VSAYRIALGRLPSNAELAAVLGFLGQQQAQIAADAKAGLSREAVRMQALAAFALVLFNTNEFAYVQ